jgi:Spy/CpxP family protein refolding chaperone
MTTITKRVGLTLVAGVIALGALGALGRTAGAIASAQNTNQDPGAFKGPHAGRGRGGMLGPMGPGGALGMLRMLGSQLGLTDAQKDQLKAIADAHRAEWQALGDRARAAHDALSAAITGDKLDDALIRSKSAEVAAVEADMAVAAAHARAEAWQVLTPEQREKAKQLQAQAREHRGPNGRRRGAAR